MPANQKTNYRGPVLRIAVPSPLRRLFDYLPLDEPAPSTEVKPGTRVRISFGNRKLVGIVIEIVRGSSLPANKLKPILNVLDNEPLFTQSVFNILLWSANYYQHPTGEVFSTAMPSKLRAGIQLNPERQVWKIAKSITAEKLLSISRAPKQKALFDFIESQSTISRTEIQQAGFSNPLLVQLSTKGLICSKMVPALDAKPFNTELKLSSSQLKLNKEQQSAVNLIRKKLGAYSSFLLDGVTGSGKTEVYMRVMQTQLSQGKQCLVLVPEIGLTPQTIARFKDRFHCRVVALHSGLNETERLSGWSQARDGSAGIIIGTRSSIFTPMASPGLIIVDEEHDSSFKQQDGFRYSARDLAVIRAREEKICVVLGSATPSLESIHNANSKKFTHLKLPNRTGVSSPQNSIQLVDIASENLEEGFSEQLLYKIGIHIEAGNQVLVFINRRGFAPVLNCQSCGWVAECEKCDTRFTVHANPSSLRCHHCSTFRRLPNSCPQCKSKSLNTIGIGTQRIESLLKRKFPKTPVIRIDRDSTRGKTSLAKMLEQVNQGDSCILLGTQMLAKGHHFPNITLAAIVDADAGLFSADFRGQEHMAQTIVQVAGRAGRADRAGEVLIQSRHSSHATLQSLSSNSYLEFTETQLQERKNSLMPPYSHLCLLRAESGDLKMSIGLLDKIAAIIDSLCTENKMPIECLGPLPAPMEKRAGRFRVHLLLKSRNRGALQSLLSQLCVQIDNMRYSQKLRLSIDVDPQDLI